MKPEEWNQLEAVYEAGLDLPTRERPAFWQSQFHDKPALRAELDLLIRGEQEAAAAGFLDQAAWRFTAAGATAAGTREEANMVGQTIGTYEIIRPIGKGGMGEVYLAKDKRLAREVALKLVKDTLNREIVARFQDEMRILCKLEHDNVARLYDGGTDDDGRPFMVMEYLRDFTTLREVLRKAKGAGLPLAQVREITRQFCTGLAQAHDKDIVHRDVKPENIMLVNDQDGLRVKVIDFGIAIPPAFLTDELDGDFLTHRPSTISPGTTVYKSPEQMANHAREAIKNTSDVYSFGLVLYEMLTGRLHFPSEEHRVYDKQPVPASTLRPELGTRIDAVIQRALSPQPQDRQPDIRALANEVIAALPEAGAPTDQPGIGVSPQPTEHITPETVARAALRSTPPVLETQPLPVVAKPRKRWLVPSVSLAAILLLAALSWSVWSARPAAVSPPLVSPPTPAINVPMNTVPRMTLTTLRNNEASPAAADATWRNGDVVKFKLSFRQDGYVYVLNHGSDGALNVLYPHQNANHGDHRVVANRSFELPPAGSTPSGGWRLDTQTGTETFYLVFAPTDAQQDELLKPIKAAVQAVGDKREFATLDTAKLDGWFRQLQRQAETRDETGILVKAIRLKHAP